LATRLIANQPSISIVTPSFNQAPFLEAAIRSVLDQNYTPLEYVVMDGGSTDGSVEILERYSSRLTAWTSEPDEGQYEAVGKGIARTKGEILGWINSDDAYLPGSLSMVGEIFARFPQIEWVTTLCPIHWDERGRPVRADHVRGFNRLSFLAGEYLPTPGAFSLGRIQQESTFWRRSLWERAGGRIDPEFPLAGDFALWAQFYQHAELVGVAAPLGGFRIHSGQKTARALARYNEEAAHALVKYGGRHAAGFQRPVREIASRMPTATQPALAALGFMHRASIVQWNLSERDWKLEKRFI
jgi:hypothetical protein